MLLCVYTQRVHTQKVKKMKNKEQSINLSDVLAIKLKKTAKIRAFALFDYSILKRINYVPLVKRKNK